ncbi:hypothetical protein SCP_0101940 [Sparassis crispa]|uniref:Uncharacterized protein n=1 Tax=Sparassis crispa TaxID=139825 RepID=A0A401G582_9APHY|nr:hypothetical protein SCP_0101940 [Sparassis crispa]GBE77321.1 hypothetical protein SCP_0101940 [Sparassis crispa]
MQQIMANRILPSAVKQYAVGTEPVREVAKTFSSEGSSSEVSFMPGQAAISSTPATTSRFRTVRENCSSTSQDSDPLPRGLRLSSRHL